MTETDRPNILLVDDQPGKLLTYEAILSDLDAGLYKAASGREALELLLKSDFAVILVDVCMPDLDGFELVQMIREHHRFQETAIIYVSAVQVSDLDMLKGYASGAVDYISVPVIPEILRAKVAVFVDLYRKTRQLEKLNVALEQRVDEVRRRTEELEAANREMEGFTYSIAHDLRAPLRAIVSTSCLLEEEHSRDLSEAALEKLRRQALNANRLAELVDDLLRLSRIGRAPMVRKALNLSEIAEVVQDHITDQIENVKISVEKEMHATGDPSLLRTVFENLLDNAVKYSSPTRPTVVEIGASKNGGQVSYFVRDNGIGFDMKYVEKIFKPFERLHRSEEVPGTGIGLANVQRIVERHGGRAWAESGGNDKGATFWFTLGNVDMPNSGPAPGDDRSRSTAPSV